MRISIIIVSWNVRNLLEQCLVSIYQSQTRAELEVFVVDNDSHDGSVDMLEKKFSKVKLIQSKKNLGFGRANNVALERATGDYILFLNPDTELFPATLENSLAFMRNNPKCGIMGCQLLNPDHSIQPSVRRFPTLLPILQMFLKLPKLSKKLRAVNHYLATDFDYEKEQEVDQIMGSFMFARKEALDKVGDFDKRIFIWFEEVDLCKRFWNKKYKVMYSPDIKIIHHGGQSFSQVGLVKSQWRFFSSAWKYFMKHNFKNIKK